MTKEFICNFLKWILIMVNEYPSLFQRKYSSRGINWDMLSTRM